MKSRSLLVLFAFAVIFAATFAAPTASIDDLIRELEPSHDPEMSPEESPEEEVCVDAAHLADYPASSLVHASHIDASVLCPASSTLPCATADHMVRVAGKSISYRQLCERRACEKRSMPVNSVLVHAWEETTHEEDVVLTMFDARHPELVQRVLHRITALNRAVRRTFQ